MDYKLEFNQQLFQSLEAHKNQNIILIGDFNIAHKEIDLARPKENKNSTMFTPLERKQIDYLINLGFKDTYRMFNSGSGNYIWWPYFYNSRERNLGWRIDYAFVFQKFSKNVKSASIYPEINFSDHCPIGIEI